MKNFRLKIIDNLQNYPPIFLANEFVTNPIFADEKQCIKVRIIIPENDTLNQGVIIKNI